jgi:hypothetical protein
VISQLKLNKMKNFNINPKVSRGSKKIKSKKVIKKEIKDMWKKSKKNK